MNNTFLGAVEKRRSNYDLSSECPVSDEQLQQIVETAIVNAPSAFNSQTSRVVLAKGEEHKAFWDMVLSTLKEVTPAENFPKTEEKIRSFAAAHGTILYFEDQNTIKTLQEQFPLYAQNFPVWSEHHSGLLQYIIWTALADADIGANLQHYNPLIDDQVKSRWNLPQNWKLVAQMPFGKCNSTPGEKDSMAIAERLLVIG